MTQKTKPNLEARDPGDKSAPTRKHKATYATDKRKGGYLIRVEGPHASAFSKRTVPVTRRDGTESEETIDRLIWSGLDSESGQPVALYTFIPKEKELEDEIPF